jgi:TrmH family RNA methyltransferase
MRIKITSVENKAVKLARRLLTKKGRDSCGYYLIEGPKLLAEALDHDAKILFAFFCEETPGGAETRPFHIASLAERTARAGADALLTTERVFRGISDAETPQGVVAVAEKPVFCAETVFSRAGANILVLDRIQDPGNIGSLIRTADAAGFGGVIAISGAGDPYGPKAVRASAGALFRMPVLFAGGAAETVTMLRAVGKRVTVADARGAVSCYDADLARDLALVIGNEGGGPSKTFSENASLTVSIPMPGGAESLNAAAAAAVLMFESLRQRSYSKESPICKIPNCRPY